MDELWGERKAPPPPLVASHTLRVRSAPTVTIRDPSGLNDAEVTPDVCPARVRISAPVVASQTFAVVSKLAVTIRRPSRLNSAEVTAEV
jgi:hypothetical protein